MTLVEKINSIFSKQTTSSAQRAVRWGHPNAAENPTDAQKRIGNYQKVHLNLDGFSISIENPKGSVRRGVSPDGTRWSNVMACDYGYIRGTKGVDGDLIDIYLSDHPEFGQVYVIDQVDPRTKEFDEHKVMYGFNSVEEAKKAYLACYSPGWKGLGWITPVTKADFREWLDSSARKRKPFHEYKSVDPITASIKVAQALGQQAASPDGKKKEDEYEGVPQGVKLRSFIDAPATRTAIMDNVLEAVKNRFPIEDDDVRLELRDVKYEGPTSYTLEQQKNALLNNRRLGCGISGTWRLTDKKTGQVLDERRDGVLRVPYYTDRGTIINNGSEYTVISQARLSPGVYVRRKQNGELESQFNVENGLGFRIGLNRETGVLDMSIGQGHVPLYPVLRAIGVSDDDIRKSWGDKVASVNVGKMDPRALDKVYARYAGSKADQSLSMAEKAKFVTEALSGSKLDPNVVVRTLGLENVNGVTWQVMLRAAQKLLNINRGEEDPDERDNPRFSKYYGIEDMLRERIDKDSGRLTKSILFRAKRDKSLARVGRNALAPYLDTFLSGSGLAMPGEEANPLSLLTQQSRITRLGEGGISSPDLVTPEARNVQGDYLGYVDFISGPESFGIGIDVRAALGTMKGSDHRLYNKMIDMQTGRTRYVALDDASSHTVAFPGQDPKAPKLYAMRKGVPTLVPREEVDYMVPGFGNTVSAGINMTPMPTAVQAGRQFYMSKFWEQYLPQKEGEVPLVDSLMDDGKTTYSEYYGRKVGCLTAPFAGTVVKANDKEIVVRGKDGQTHTTSLVKGLPFNRLSAISYTPQVKKGDEIAEGGILANSNFTDAKTGAMNMGRNLKVAVLPAPLGVSSYEDAIVISESAAKKLSTSRMYNFDQDTKDGVQIQRNKYLAAFPKAYTKDQADTIDDNGVVKVGTVLHRDDPMILAIGPKMLSAEDAQLGKLSSVLRNALTDKSQKWEHDWPGVVTDVVAGPHGVKVLVKSEPPVKVGDKLAPEEGLKGVVGGILPDDKMPRDSVTNEPYDMLMNPMGFLSRVAPGQIMLMNLAKVAKKTGKQIRIPQIPPPEGWEAWVEKQMVDAGVKESADVFDPQTGRIIKDVGDGYVYTKAFHHLAEKKFSARGVEGAYTQDEQPAKGGADGAKRLSTFDDLSLLSHGATEVIKDSIVTRGSYNDEYWRRYRLGLPVKEPDVPFIYKKFINTLKAGGVNVVEKGDVTSLMPQTDADIDELAQGRVIDSSQMVDADMNPVNGGLFDLSRTGGMGGNRWSMITLPEAVPNPMMEEPVRRVLGLTGKKMEAIMSGREQLNGKTGGEALRSALASINVDDAIERARAEVQNYRGSQRDNAVKVLGYLKAAKEMGKRPEDWMITRIPVLPPMFRPIAKMGDTALVPDMNELYKELIEMKRNYEDLSKELPASALADERLAVYGAVKAAYGLGDPVTAEGRAKNLKGAIRQVIGTVPKCYDSETEILTTDGWIKFGNVTMDHTVATVDPSSLKMEWQQPTDVIHTEYNGFMVHTQSKKIDLLVTPNHSHFVRARYGAMSGKPHRGEEQWGPWKKMDAAEILYSGSRLHMLTAPAGYDGIGEPDYPGVDDKGAFAFLCGMYVAEGWDTTYSANICQSSANDDICRLIRDKVSVCGVKFSETTYRKNKGRTCTYWSIYSKEGAGWFRENFGHLAGGKRLSKKVLEWKPEYLRQLLDGYLYGDGEKSHGRKDPKTNRTFYNKDILTCEHSGASTSSRDLVDGMAELCMKIGLGFRLVDIVEFANPKWNKQYRFRVDGWNKVIIEGSKYHKWEMYSGLVHCVTVPNGLLVVRRNGMTAISGNCGMFQAKVISKTQDLVGRSVITPNRNYDMDQIGIPEDMAWKIFKPFVERKLVQRGYSPVDSKKMIDDRNPTAKHILEDVMEERPVLMDRAPTWHKFNIMAFRPHIVEGRTINVCPTVCSGFAADFDGNCVDYDSALTVRMSKSTLDIAKKICDNMLHTNLEKEYAMTDANTSIRVVDGDQIEMNIKIGTFPRVGTPKLDKNGARMYQVPEGIKVLSVDPVTGARSFEPVTMFTHESGCDTVKVSYGAKSVIVSSNESLAVFDSKEGRLVRVKPVESEKRMTPVLVSSTEKFGSFGDRDLGWLFGAFISDGWSSDRMVGYTKIEKCKRDEFVRILRANHENFNLCEYTGHKGDGKLGDSVKIHCNSSTVAAWIHQWQFLHEDVKNADGKRSALYKMIDPKLIESGSEEFLWGLMSGLLDGDGSIVCNTARKNPRYTFRLNTSSPYLRDGICRLCHKLGLRYAVTTNRPRGWSNESYVVMPSTVDIFSKIDHLSCIGDHERKIVAELVGSGKKPVDNADMIPVSDAELEGMRGLPSFTSGCPLYVTMLKTRKQGAMRGGRTSLMRMIDELKSREETSALAERVLNTNTKWVQISAVEDAGVRDVFDLEVATTKTFVINDGVVVWDTVNIHVPASEKAAKQALEKMLPSKNLISLTDLKSVRYKPEKEQISGLWALTRGKTRKPTRVFATKAEATAAYRNGEIGPNDPIKIKDM